MLVTSGLRFRNQVHRRTLLILALLFFFVGPRAQARSIHGLTMHSGPSDDLIAKFPVSLLPDIPGWNKKSSSFGRPSLSRIIANPVAKCPRSNPSSAHRSPPHPPHPVKVRRGEPLLAGEEGTASRLVARRCQPHLARPRLHANRPGIQGLNRRMLTFVFPRSNWAHPPHPAESHRKPYEQGHSSSRKAQSSADQSRRADPRQPALTPHARIRPPGPLREIIRRTGRLNASAPTPRQRRCIQRRSNFRPWFNHNRLLHLLNLHT